jgi:tartrate dehydratase beta subunit/fumarate hydratase class I family protein
MTDANEKFTIKIVMIKLAFPFTEEKIRALKVGDEVLFSGVGFAGREH